MKRYSPWMKANKSKNLEYVKEYFGYNNEKAKQGWTYFQMMTSP